MDNNIEVRQFEVRLTKEGKARSFKVNTTTRFAALLIAKAIFNCEDADIASVEEVVFAI